MSPAGRSERREPGTDGAHPGEHRDRASTGLLVGAGALVVVAGSVAATAFPPAHTGWRLALLAALVGGFAAGSRNVYSAVATACLAWPTLLGFLVDRQGELHWHGPVDMVRLAVLVGAALAGSAVGEALEAMRRNFAETTVREEERNSIDG